MAVDLFLMKAGRLIRKVIDGTDIPPETTLKVLETLLYIAVNDGCSQVELRKALNITQATMSRIVALLGTTGVKQRGERGAAIGLVQKRPDPEDLRRTLISLTPKGHEFFMEFRG